MLFRFVDRLDYRLIWAKAEAVALVVPQETMGIMFVLDVVQ